MKHDRTDAVLPDQRIAIARLSRCDRIWCEKRADVRSPGKERACVRAELSIGEGMQKASMKQRWSCMGTHHLVVVWCCRRDVKSRKQSKKRDLQSPTHFRLVGPSRQNGLCTMCQDLIVASRYGQPNIELLQRVMLTLRYHLHLQSERDNLE